MVKTPVVKKDVALWRLGPHARCEEKKLQAFSGC